MTYSPHTDADRERMLAAVGVESVEDLFADIPASVRAGAWDVPPPLAEQEVRAEGVAKCHCAFPDRPDLLIT